MSNTPMSSDADEAAAVALRQFLAWSAGAGDADDRSDEESLLPFDETAPSAWPFYQAMLEVASSPSEIAYVGWQLIPYYFYDAQDFWPQNGTEIVEIVAEGATKSRRLGQLLSKWLLFHWSEAAPAAAVLAVEILDRKYNWQMSKALLAMSVELKSDPDPVAQFEPFTTYNSPEFREGVVQCVDPTFRVTPRPSPWEVECWAEAVSADADATLPAPGDAEILESLRALQRQPEECEGRRKAQSVIVRALRGGASGVGRDADVRNALADTLVLTHPLASSIALRALERLLRRIDEDGRREERTESMWLEYHHR